jgi:predicted transcriptional regulator
MGGEDLVELLRLRHGVLGALVDDPRPRHELVDALPESKSTTYKGLSQLEEAGLVERINGEFAPTLFGTVALARYDSLAETAEFAGLLSGLPGGTIDPAALVGASVVRPDETDGERHVEALWGLLDGVDRARGIVPVVSPGMVDRFREHLGRGLSAELILPSGVVESLRTEHPSVLAAVSEQAVLYETTTTIRFGLLVIDGTHRRMAIELRDGPHVIGLITNDTPDALTWADATFERFRTDASRVTFDQSER